MRENINKVSQRGERLDSLQDKTDNLATSAQGFRRGANRVRKQMWWKDMKMRVCIIVGIIILLLIIIIPSGKTFNGNDHIGNADMITSRCYEALDALERPLNLLLDLENCVMWSSDCQEKGWHWLRFGQK